MAAINYPDGIVWKEIIDSTDATATPDDIIDGKTAWVNDTKITGNIPDYREVYPEMEATFIVDLDYQASSVPINYTDGVSIVLGDTIHLLGCKENPRAHYGFYVDEGSYFVYDDLPYDFVKGSAAVLNDELYIIGSSISGNYKKFYKWNEIKDTWSVVNSALPTGLEVKHNGAITFQNKIHVFNGVAHYTWTPSEGWKQLSNSLMTYTDGCLTTFGDSAIALIGGRGSSTTCVLYNSNGTYTTLDVSLPYNFTYGCGGCVKNEETGVYYLIIMGGTGQKKTCYTFTNSSIDANANKWQKVNNLPYDCYKATATIYNNKIHIFGGDGTDTDAPSISLKTMHMAGELSYDIQLNTTLTEILPMYASGITYNSKYHNRMSDYGDSVAVCLRGTNYIHFFGTYYKYTSSTSNSYSTNTLQHWMYDISSKTWTQKASISNVFTHVLSLNNKIYGLYDKTMYIWTDNTWTSVALPGYVKKGYSSFFIVNNELHLFANDASASYGQVYESKHWKYSGNSWILLEDDTSAISNFYIYKIFNTNLNGDIYAFPVAPNTIYSSNIEDSSKLNSEYGNLYYVPCTEAPILVLKNNKWISTNCIVPLLTGYRFTDSIQVKDSILLELGAFSPGASNKSYLYNAYTYSYSSYKMIYNTKANSFVSVSSPTTNTGPVQYNSGYYYEYDKKLNSYNPMAVAKLNYNTDDKILYLTIPLLQFIFNNNNNLFYTIHKDLGVSTFKPYITYAIVYHTSVSIQNGVVGHTIPRGYYDKKSLLNHNLNFISGKTFVPSNNLEELPGKTYFDSNNFIDAAQAPKKAVMLRPHSKTASVSMSTDGNLTDYLPFYNGYIVFTLSGTAVKARYESDDGSIKTADISFATVTSQALGFTLQADYTMLSDPLAVYVTYDWPTAVSAWNDNYSTWIGTDSNSATTACVLTLSCTTANVYTLVKSNGYAISGATSIKYTWNANAATALSTWTSVSYELYPEDATEDCYTWGIIYNIWKGNDYAYKDGDWWWSSLVSSDAYHYNSMQIIQNKITMGSGGYITMCSVAPSLADVAWVEWYKVGQFSVAFFSWSTNGTNYYDRYVSRHGNKHAFKNWGASTDSANYYGQSIGILSDERIVQSISFSANRTVLVLKSSYYVAATSLCITQPNISIAFPAECKDIYNNMDFSTADFSFKVRKGNLLYYDGKTVRYIFQFINKGENAYDLFYIGKFTKVNNSVGKINHLPGPYSTKQDTYREIYTN